MSNMNKGDLIALVSDKSGTTKAVSENVVNAFIESVTESLKKGNTLTLVGFGTFSVGDRAARNGRNPQTGAAIKIPASRVPKFKAGKGLKDAVKK